MSVGKANLTLAVRLRRVATTNQTRGQAHGAKQPQTKFFNSGYSSVGRASDCRFCRHQMVPGSIPGGRIYGYGGHVRQNFFKKRCWVTRLPTHVLLSAPARRLGRHGAAHCLEKATHMQCTRPKIEKNWEHHCLSVLLLLWSD